VRHFPFRFSMLSTSSGLGQAFFYVLLGLRLLL